ncbi:NAD(P)/FAD-dependent oxidoreductase [Roseibium sediminis]|uniref:NAD(P)/FAD-dependent oxidoreductase n=1 Tax=Roseibium sediminis TaxID=1775174 RepID=UPI00123E3E47|nr:FAD-binding oxidoreductase [Roseibium sediminis]
MSFQPRRIGSFWEASVADLVRDPQLEGDQQAEVAIVGGGYAGLSAALRLALQGIRVVVLEAEHVGWGASGRNGGFCCYGGTKKSGQELARAYGLDEARSYVRYQCEAMDTVETRLDDWGADVDRHSKGEVILAHRPSDYLAFADEIDWTNRTFGLKHSLLRPEELKEQGLGGAEFHGGYRVHEGFALNPMKYVLALAEQARKAGAAIHGQSRTSRLQREGGGWRLETDRGSVRAKKVILAGNGYRDENLPAWLYGRTLPVMSSILVTRPMSDDELAAQGWTSDLMAADSRILLHYFRLLPDRRFLFGTRGGLVETPAALERMSRKGRADFERMFPAWAGVETQYSWYGHVCLSWNLTPYVGAVPECEGIYTAMAWHGSGIAMASLSGEKVADLALGRISASDIPGVMRTPFRRFPVPPFRLAYLQMAYWWYGLKDRI